MDINLPLYLFIAVAVSGFIWLVDFLFFQKKRELALTAVDGEFASLSEAQKKTDPSYQRAMEKVGVEPVLVEYSKSFFPILFFVFVLRSFIIEPFQIPSESMVPTLEVGDFILVNKFSYGVRLPLVRKKIVDIGDPERGDVMVFFPPHEERYFIKRVIGLPGDSIRYSNHVLYVNGEEIKQELVEVEELAGVGGCPDRYILMDEYIGDEPRTVRKCNLPGPLSIDGSWVVPEGHYFMMGDNRDNSADSRKWGVVPEDRIVGKAFAIWMHWESFFSVPSFSRVGSI